MQSVLQEYQAGQIQYISSKETEKTLIENMRVCSYCGGPGASSWAGRGVRAAPGDISCLSLVVGDPRWTCACVLPVTGLHPRQLEREKEREHWCWLCLNAECISVDVCAHLYICMHTGIHMYTYAYMWAHMPTLHTHVGICVLWICVQPCCWSDLGDGPPVALSPSGCGMWHLWTADIARQ